MSVFEVRVSFKSTGIKTGKIPMAIARGLNEGGDLVRTRVQRALKLQTNVKAYRSITSRIRTMRAFPGGFNYQIIATGKGIPILEFPFAVTAKGVDAKTWGVDHLFKRSFMETNGALRARIGRSRYPVRRLYGPSLPKELGKGQSAAAFDAATTQFVPAAIIKHLGRVLG